MAPPKKIRAGQYRVIEVVSELGPNGWSPVDYPEEGVVVHTRTVDGLQGASPRRLVMTVLVPVARPLNEGG